MFGRPTPTKQLCAPPSRRALAAWLDEWVYGLANHGEYVEKFGDAYWDALRPEPALSGEVDYGRYA